MLGLGWRAADIYATRRHDSHDAILEAAMELAELEPGKAFYLPLYRTALDDRACYLARLRLTRLRWPDDPSSWVNWQSLDVNLWPVLAAAATMSCDSLPGRYVA